MESKTDLLCRDEHAQHVSTALARTCSRCCLGMNLGLACRWRACRSSSGRPSSLNLQPITPLARTRGQPLGQPKHLQSTSLSVCVRPYRAAPTPHSSLLPQSIGVAARASPLPPNDSLGLVRRQPRHPRRLALGCKLLARLANGGAQTGGQRGGAGGACARVAHPTSPRAPSKALKRPAIPSAPCPGQSVSASGHAPPMALA